MLEARFCLSGFYDLEVVAQTGGLFTGIGIGPSINDNGYIAFIGESPNSEGEPADNVYAYNTANGTTKALMNEIFMLTNAGADGLTGGTQAFHGQVQINNQNEVLARRRLNALIQVGFPFGDILTAPLTYLETWDADASNPPGLPSSRVAMGLPAGPSAPLWFFLNPVTGAQYPSPLDLGSPYEAIYASATINNLGHVNSSAIVRNAGNNRIATDVLGNLVARGGIGELVIRPVLADNDWYVFTTDDGRVFVEKWSMTAGPYILADSSRGFSAVSGAGISDDGNVIAFAASNDVTGDGIYVSVFEPTTQSYLEPIKVLGASGDGTLDPGEWHDDLNQNGRIEPGEDVNGIDGFDLSSPVAINRTEIDEANNYTIAFLANGYASGPGGLFTLRVETDNRPEPQASQPIGVVSYGDNANFLSGEITSISLHDSINNHGKIVFAVSTSTAQQAILLASREVKSAKPNHAFFEYLAKGLAYWTLTQTDGQWPLPAPYQDNQYDYILDEVFVDNSTGFYAAGLISEAFDPILVLRGTDFDSPLDWWADADPSGIGYRQFATNWDAETGIRKWLSEDLDVRDKPVHLTGHSLGGALAQWVASALTGMGRAIGEVITFNSPGIAAGGSGLVTDAGRFDSALSQGVTHYIVNGDIVSLAGRQFLAGQFVTAQFDDPFWIDMEKHTRPVLTPSVSRPGGVTVTRPATVKLSQRQPTALLNDPGFGHDDPDMWRWLTGARTVLASIPPTRHLAWLPLLLSRRDTAESGRQLIGHAIDTVVQLKQIGEATFEWVTDAGRSVIQYLTDRQNELQSLVQLEFDSDFEFVVDMEYPQGVGFVANTSLTLGDDIRIELPSWLGGTIAADHLIELFNAQLNARHDVEKFAVSGEWQVFAGLLKVQGGAILNWAYPGLYLNGESDFLDGFVQTGARVFFDGRKMNASGAASVGVPTDAPAWMLPGATLSSGQVLLQYTHDESMANDSLSAWGSLGPINIGWRISFDGGIQWLGADQIDGLVANGGEGESAASTEQFQVAPDTNWVLFWADREQGLTAGAVSLVTPSGQSLNADELADHPGIRLLDQLSSSNRKAILVESPESGTWTIRVEGGAAEPVAFHAIRDTPTATIHISSIDTSDLSRVRINYHANGNSADARVSLYYSTSPSGQDGILIADGLAAVDGEQFVWDTSAVPSGRYYIQAVVAGGSDIPRIAGSPEGVSIDIDLQLPGSAVYPLPPEVASPFDVTWFGQDDPDGSGVRFFDVYASVDGGPYRLWLARTNQSSASFAGDPGRSYSFYTIATDHAGNQQSTDAMFEARTLVVSGSIPWQNPILPMDVNDDGEVTPLDALLILNRISRAQREGITGGIPVGSLGDETPRNYYDTDRSGRIEPLDALLVLNQIARNQRQGEGEWFAAPWPPSSSTLLSPNLQLNRPENSSLSAERQLLPFVLTEIVNWDSGWPIPLTEVLAPDDRAFEQLEADSFDLLGERFDKLLSMLATDGPR